MNDNFDKIIKVGATVWASYTIINFLIPKDINIEINKNTISFICASYIGYSLFNALE